MTRVPEGDTGLAPRSSTDALPAADRRRSTLSRRILAAACAVAGLAVAWYGYSFYRDYPLRMLPEVDLSLAHPAVKRALENARRAVVASPRSGRAWGDLGLYLRAHEFNSEANVCFAQAMRFDPREVLWPYLRASSLSVRNRPEAQEGFRLAARLRPDLALPHLRLGEMHLEDRRLDEARAEYQQGLEIEPESARAMLGLALAAFHQGDLDVARDWAEKSFARDPEQRTTAELLVRVFQRKGDRAAVSKYRAVLERLPAGEAGWEDPFGEKVVMMRRDPGGMASHATDLLARNRVPEAIAVLEQLAGTAPETVQWPVLLGRALTRQGNLRRAAQVLDAALVRHDDSADLQFQRGAVDFFQGQWERAAERFHKAIALKPDFSDAHYNLGHTLVHLNDRAAAIASFREAIRFRPDFAAAHTNLGKLLLEAGDREAAREAIATAARLAPDDPQNKQLLEKLK